MIGRSCPRATARSRRLGNALATACCLGALIAGPLRAWADENVAAPSDARAVAAPVAGALTLFVPLVVGGALIAHDDDRAMQRDAVRLMVASFVAAPIVSHAVAGRWRRALVFGLVSAATAAATLVAMSERDPFDPSIRNHQRLAFGFLFTASFFAGAGGVVDSLAVGPSPRAN